MGFLRAREVEALSSLWDLNWDPPKYSNPRRVYPLIRPEKPPVAATTANPLYEYGNPIPVPFKNPPSTE